MLIKPASGNGSFARFARRQLVLLGCALSASLAQADEDFWHASAGARELWDSNFSRKPVADEEDIVHSTASLSIRETLGRQLITANWQVNRFDHQTYTDFNGTTHSGDLNWKGEFGSQLNAQASLLRQSYMVDRFEFFGNDRVDRDELNGRLGFGNNQRLTFHLGGRETHQRHSNGLRQGLDYDEQEGFVDVGYQTSSRSTVTLRARSGNRSYINDPFADDVLDPVAQPLNNKRDLNFDYNQGELEAEWVLSPKTRVALTLARYKREGEINEATGSLVSLEAKWQATEKISFNGGYSYREPALGESSDSPAKIHESSVGLQWNLTQRLSLTSNWRYSLRRYENLSAELVRDEHLSIFSPLSVSYNLGDRWQVRADAGWRKNESPLEQRQYISRTASIGLMVAI
jgi:hypothetical protein